jgi:Protein of unknown function (DUF1579)
MRGIFAATMLAVLLAAAPGRAALDGAGIAMSDPLLDKMVGHWTMTGTLLGHPATHDVDVDWILDHQFLRIHEVDRHKGADGKPGYEAMPLIGYDNTSERYVAHWIDAFGGRWSETLGYGKREGDAVTFVFEYPDGPFRTTFRRDGAQWHWSMTQKGADGAWKPFAEMTLSPR